MQQAFEASTKSKSITHEIETVQVDAESSQTALPALTQLRLAIAELANEGYDAESVMHHTWQLCVELMPSLRKRLEEQEQKQMLEQIEDLRQRGRLAFA
jgi:hypothetical protein